MIKLKNYMTTEQLPKTNTLPTSNKKPWVLSPEQKKDIDQMGDEMVQSLRDLKPDEMS
jgi:hypothetical protein